MMSAVMPLENKAMMISVKNLQVHFGFSAVAAPAISTLVFSILARFQSSPHSIVTAYPPP